VPKRLGGDSLFLFGIRGRSVQGGTWLIPQSSMAHSNHRIRHRTTFSTIEGGFARLAPTLTRITENKSSCICAQQDRRFSGILDASESKRAHRSERPHATRVLRFPRTGFSVDGDVKAISVGFSCAVLADPDGTKGLKDGLTADYPNSR